MPVSEWRPRKHASDAPAGPAPMMRKSVESIGVVDLEIRVGWFSLQVKSSLWQKV
jgi:hypothetical protein